MKKIHKKTAKKIGKEIGFTLIELLAVIAIVALLSSIILGSLQKAREKASVARAAQSTSGFRLALALYYSDNNTYPASANGTMVITNAPGQAWDTFYTKIKPYFAKNVADFPYVISAGFVSSGMIYMKGTESNPMQQPMYDSLTGAYLGCIKIYDGYWLATVVPYDQSSVTVKDGGFDPDSIEAYDGHVVIYPNIPIGACPTSAVVF